MSTLVDEDIDTWLEDVTEDGTPCEAVKLSTGESCPREAVFNVLWRGDDRMPDYAQCRCVRSTHACLLHGEEYQGLHLSTKVVLCVRCENFMVPAVIDRIRRSA